MATTDKTKLNELEQAALCYAGMGWQVFPCLPKDKKPATEHGFKDATTNKDTIKAWWAQNPNYNIGIATGQASNGLCVIDLDNDADKGKDGTQVFKQWCSDNRVTPPPTLAVKTGRGGQHIFYHTSKQLGCKTDLLKGIDIRADGGYIVAPPSIHPNGNKYEWWDKAKPDNMTLADLTPQLETFVMGNTKAAGANIAAGVQKIAQGGRTAFLVSKMGYLCNGGMDDVSIRKCIESINANMCEPPLTESELSRDVFKSLNRGWQNGFMEQLPDLVTISGNDLLQKDIPPLKYIIDGILPEGFGLLAAPPKSYKSFLCLQICMAVSRGEKVFGRDTHKTKCLYFDLESSNRRPQQRLKDMGADIAAVDGLYFVTKDELKEYQNKRGCNEPLTLSNGFAEVLEGYLTKNPDIGLVIIDVFGKIRTEQKKTQQLYDHDYADIDKLQSIAARMNVSILAVHHTTKARDETNVFNNMGGSTGLFGAADFGLIINKAKFNDDEATLHTAGRDIEQNELSIKWDASKLNWIYQGTAADIQAQRVMDEYLNSHITQTIKKAVEMNGGVFDGTTTDIIKASNYYGIPITEKPQQVGMFIQSHRDLFEIEAGLEIGYDRKENKRKYLIKNI